MVILSLLLRTYIDVEIDIFLKQFLQHDITALHIRVEHLPARLAPNAAQWAGTYKALDTKSIERLGSFLYEVKLHGSTWPSRPPA
jgi:hypothetical protein